MLRLEHADACYEALDQGALLLTPNHRLAVALHENHAAQRRQRKLGPVYSSPAISAIDVWVREQWQTLCWQEADKDWPQLLPPAHELLLWRDIIRDSAAGKQILNPDATARAASEAHNLMQQYKLSGADIETWLKDNWLLREEYLDISHFLRWRETFLEKIEQSSLLTLTQITGELTRALQDSVLEPPQRVLLFGFSAPPPLYRDLLQTLTGNIEEASLALSTSTLQCHLQHYASDIAEMRAAVDWAADIHKQDSNSRIGILCTELGGKADILRRLLSQQFETRQFNINDSGSIEQRPLIATALNMLDLNRESLDTLECCRLLQSPFLYQAGEELTQRVALEERLRNKGEQELSPSTLRSLCQQQRADFHCPELGSRLQQFAELVRHESNKAQPLSHWLPLIQQQLEILGWPGERELSLEEKQDLEGWQQLLDELQQCQSYQQAMPWLQALALLRQLAGNQRRGRQRFSAEVQVMSPAEAEHLQFSHLWIMGMSDQQWPPAMHNNPLIPWPLQQEFDFPLCSREIHQEWHKQLILRLASLTGTELRLSYTSMLDDVPAKACAIARQLSPQQKAAAPEHGDSTLLPAFYHLAADTELANREENPYLPLSPEENPKGGASVLEHQATCPFKSFAIHRLDSRELQVPGYGLSPMAAGTLLHSAMEYLWQQLQSYQQLQATSPEARQILCKKVSKDAVSEAARQFPQLMQPRFQKLEQQRLQELLLDWLEEEDKRQFSHIMELEKSLTWDYGNLHLRLKLDRLEKLADNSLSIIDYKSGKKANINWCDPRPEQPQLLLYLEAVEKLYPQETVSAILLAYINSVESRFTGRCNADTDYHEISVQHTPGGQEAATWEELRAIWAHSLVTLADEFNHGLFSVTPKKPAYDCRHCHIKPFCRIQENTSALEGEEANTDEEGRFD